MQASPISQEQHVAVGVPIQAELATFGVGHIGLGQQVPITTQHRDAQATPAHQERWPEVKASWSSPLQQRADSCNAQQAPMPAARDQQHDAQAAPRPRLGEAEPWNGISAGSHAPHAERAPPMQSVGSGASCRSADENAAVDFNDGQLAEVAAIQVSAAGLRAVSEQT
jgi:hypothetical protein